MPRAWWLRCTTLRRESWLMRLVGDSGSCSYRRVIGPTCLWTAFYVDNAHLSQAEPASATHVWVFPPWWPPVHRLVHFPFRTENVKKRVSWNGRYHRDPRRCNNILSGIAAGTSLDVPSDKLPARHRIGVMPIPLTARLPTGEALFCIPVLRLVHSPCFSAAMAAFLQHVALRMSSRSL